ncbi:MAG: penicillin-binding transpeptidase domain-containing protein [Nocardioidaceae bacterium]
MPVLLCLPLLAGCLVSCGGPGPEPAAKDLAHGLSELDVTGVPLVGTNTDAVNTRLDEITAGMDEIRPQVTVGRVSEHDDAATATLHVRWPLADGVAWTYDSKARIVRDGDAWAVDWKPSTLAPGLDDQHRLVHHTSAADRGEILGAHDKPIVTGRPVVRVGIDRTQVRKDKAAASARALAGLVGVDAGSYADRVVAAGDKAFVEAIVLRVDDAPAERRLASVAGARAIEDELPLAPTRTFAAPILGSVGQATSELIEKSGGRLAAGDVTGLSGLQQRYDERLSGEKAVSVESVSTADDSAEPETLFEHGGTPGEPLRTTLDVRLQAAAENSLADVGPASALVAIRPSSGDVLAAASGPGGKGYSTATVGRYAPGSTFKIVSSLAMLRDGYTLADKVPCPRTTTVDGKSFKNYDDYPADKLGDISMLTAIANSCNTAVISAHGKVSQADLSGAAASLGLGVDHDLGFPVFLGSVPGNAPSTEHAASLIGQGKVQASPLSMAVVAASVQAGRTVVPHLIADQEAPRPGARLGAGEADRLRRLMRAVVSEGSGAALRDLPGPPVGAKTGTAEYGTATPPKTHAWMIATQGDVAVAVFVANGQSGSQTAGPVIERFLRTAG